MTANPDDMLALAFENVAWEVNEILNSVSWEDVTAIEAAALLATLRPVYERMKAREACPPVPLKAVPR